jgi:CubicO group peptidase (beta-lactamase class C family)
MIGALSAGWGDTMPRSVTCNAIIGCLLSVLTAHSDAQVPAELAPRVAAPSATPAPDAPRLRPAESIPPAELEAFVDGVVRLAMDQRHIAGVTVSVVQDGHVVLLKGYGFASFDPVRAVDPATTLFRVGSISKTFTWIEVMRAVESGKLDLDKPVNDYLPPALQVPAEGFARPIRLRDLMTHSPGFEDRVFGVLFADDAAKMLPLDGFLERYRPRRVREPGALSSYSNYGAALAGAIVAHTDGADWQTLIERDILKPLNLTHVTGREPYPARDAFPAPLSADLAADLSAPFRWAGNAFAARKFEYITPVAPAGAVSASAADMASYMLMLLGDGARDGVTIFGPQAARAFRTPLTTLPIEVGALDAGFLEQRLPGGFHSYGHNGGTLSFFSNMTLVPDLRLGVFISTNTEGGAELSDPLVGRIVERFYAPPRAAQKPPMPEAAAMFHEYAGEYLSTRRRYGGLEGFMMSLQARLTVAASPEGYLLVGGGQLQRFVPAGPDLFESADHAPGGPAFVRFEREGGRVARIAIVPIGFERVGALMQRSTLGLAAGLAALSAVLVVIGALVRRGRGTPASSGQRLAGRLQLAVALLWIATAIGCVFAIAGVSDATNLLFHWPLPAVVAASSLALVASVLTVAGAPFLPAVWRSSVPGWTIGCKLRYTLALVIFAAFAALLAAWGALVPWHY